MVLFLNGCLRLIFKWVSKINCDVADYPLLQKRLYRQQGLPWNLVEITQIETPQAGKK
ncbi:hypothetical protein GCM10007414_30290 [Agarivorans gilvus]|uniref:Uncharacterized protein n=1 Tax=Agarivorans gilvus TaxID=680279 RepID=A0ABQ1I5P1_9ALTE|nr:hypothetical protein GCM10007414_30290 [Agarivorans gilvus]